MSPPTSTLFQSLKLLEFKETNKGVPNWYHLGKNQEFINQTIHTRPPVWEVGESVFRGDGDANVKLTCLVLNH